MFCMHCSTRPSAGTFQPRNSSMVTSERTHAHAHTSMVTCTRTHARAHTPLAQLSDATIDCRRVNRLRTGSCCCLCLCCQSDRDCRRVERPRTLLPQLLYAPAAALSRYSLALLFACFTCVHACCSVQSGLLLLHSYCFRLFCIGLSLPPPAPLLSLSLSLSPSLSPSFSFSLSLSLSLSVS